MGVSALVIALITLIVVLGVDFILIPLLFKTILSWFGILITLPQSIVIMLFIYILIGLNKKKG